MSLFVCRSADLRFQMVCIAFACYVRQTRQGCQQLFLPKYFLTMLESRALAEAFNRRAVIAEVRAHSQASPRGVRG